jgi:aspartate/methionine/tyrosine aminotransferase
MTDRTRVVAVASLHNPSGVRASDEALREIAALAAARGAHLLVDEVYAPFDELNDDRGVWGASARRLGPNVVAVGSLTKGWGLGAHRIGWMLAPPEVVARGEDAWIASLGHAPVPWLAFACRAFDQLGPIGARARALLAGKRARVEAWVAKRPQLTWSAPGHGLFGFAMAAQSTEDYRPRIERGIDAHQVIVAGLVLRRPQRLPPRVVHRRREARRSARAARSRPRLTAGHPGNPGLNLILPAPAPAARRAAWPPASPPRR